MQAITSKINNIGHTVTNNWVLSKCLYTVLVLHSFYQVSVHGVQAHLSLVVSDGACWWRDSTTKYLWQEILMLRQRQQNSAFNCTQ